MDGSNLSGPSRYLQKPVGSWQPLPTILNGFVVHPFSPSSANVATPTTGGSNARSHQKNRFSWSGIPSKGKATTDSGKNNVYEVPLELGDEFFAFEEYQCAQGEGGGDLWYRGYVVQSVTLHDLAPSGSDLNKYPRPEPSVLIGIFPAACVHIRVTEGNEDEALTAAYERAVQLAEGRAKSASRAGMEAVQEEDEDIQGSPPTQSNGIDIEETGQASNKRKSLPLAAGLGRSNRPKSLILANPPSVIGDEAEKDQPPLPKLTAGDSTLAGEQWPIVDEIACAIREWYSRLPTYLANREYRLFSIVMQHIDALFLGRRQLLSQTLSADELVRVRKECVSRLVKCNVAQGLEVIVRSLEDGSVMVVDRNRAFNDTSWIGGIKAYVYQVQLSYIDLVPLDTLLNKSFYLPPTTKRPFTLEKPSPSAVSAPPPFYHLLMDFRAFIASPCAPGETAELYFSLYNKAESRFLTEEFCLILNHLGSPARDPEQRLGKLRTLFIDLKREDVSGSICLICKIARNGAMKLRGEGSSSLDTNQQQNQQASRANLLGMSGGGDGTIRGSMLSIREDGTDDSFSVTSGAAPQRSMTIETATGTVTSMGDKPMFRRPLGYAVLELPQLSKLLVDSGDKSTGGAEYSVPINVPRDESLFANLHEAILAGQTKDYGTSPRSESIAVGLKLLKGSANLLIHQNPQLLLDVPLTERLGFPDVVSPESQRNDLYIKLWSADFHAIAASSGGSIRIRKSANTAANYGNVQISMEVRRNDGTIIHGTIYAGGSGEPPISQYQSMVFPTMERPTYGELVKVSLPESLECHLFLTFRSRKSTSALDMERPFAFAYLPLYSPPSCLVDGSHELILYRLDKAYPPAPSAYFAAPSEGSSDVSTSLIPLRDRVTLRTSFCSSVLTQNQALQSLFDWQNSDDLASTLSVFSFVGEEEIAKFVPRTLDSLFDVITSDRADPERMNELAFKAFIKVLAMSSDRRFTQFDYVLNDYLENHFNSPTSAMHLLRSMRTVMARPSTTDYRAFLKVWHLFFRFIIRSREIDRSRGIGLDATTAHIEADFRKQLKAVLNDINSLMQSTDRSLIGTQTLAVQHYADIMPSLGAIFQPVEIAEMVIAFADTLTHSRGSVAIYKLLLLLQVIQHVFDASESRALLVPAVVRWVKPHLGRYDEILAGLGGKNERQEVQDARRIKWLECTRLAITVVARMVDKLQDWLVLPTIQDDEGLRIQEEDNIEYCLTLLPSLCSSYSELSGPQTTALMERQKGSMSVWKETPDVFPMTHPFALISQLPPPSLIDRNSAEDGLSSTGTFNIGLAESATVIFSMILACPSPNLLRFLLEVLEIEGIETTSSTLKTIMEVASSIIQFKAFPASWLTLSLTCFSGIIKFLDTTSEILLREAFIPPVQSDEFDEDLWYRCFSLLCEVCGSPELALEEQSQQRRRAGWIIAGDLRDEGASLLLKLWNAIGSPLQELRGRKGVQGYQTRFTGLAEQILALCLSSHDRMCETAVEILFSMIYAQYLSLGTFDVIETEIFAKLHSIFSNKSSATTDPAMRAYFIAQLRSIFESTPSIDENFQKRVSAFLDEVELFIDLLLAMSDLPPTPMWKDERATALCRLMEFIRRIGRVDLYIRFIHSLVGVYLQSKDYLGAGLALRLHADVYPWKMNGDPVEAFSEGDISLPPQTPFARRESLYYHAIDHFAEAEAYEFALELCQELTLQHQKHTYHIDKLSELLVHQARLWERIGQVSRPVPEYFRVAFFGDFPSIDRGKDFVVRGSVWQRYSDFCETMQSKFPNASIHRSKIPPTLPEDLDEADEPVSIIWITSVTPEQDLNHSALQDGVIDGIQTYHRHNGVRIFSSTRPYLLESQPRDYTEEKALTWLEKTVLTTAEILPGILSRSEVVDVKYQQISPIATATTEVLKATERLRGLTRPRADMKVDAKQLGTAINGAVDSPVAGGVKLYRKAFLSGDYVERHPSDELAIQQLKITILDYVRAIQEALEVHRQVCTDIAFHEALKNHFHKAFSDEISTLPRMSESTISSVPEEGPRQNGYSEALSLLAPPTPITKDSPRPSMTSDRSYPKILHITGTSNNAYPTTAQASKDVAGARNSFILPPLRLGPSPVGGLAAALGSPQVVLTKDSASTKSKSTLTSPSNGLSRAFSLVGSISGLSPSNSGSGGHSSSNNGHGTGNGNGNGNGVNGNGTRPSTERQVQIRESSYRQTSNTISTATGSSLRSSSPAMSSLRERDDIITPTQGRFDLQEGGTLGKKEGGSRFKRFSTLLGRS